MIRKARKNELRSLKNALISQGSLSLTITSILDVEEEFNYSRTIYVAESDPKIFVFIENIFSEIPSCSLYWNKDIINDEELKLYLQSIPNWNWNRNFILSFLDISLGTKMHEMLLGEEISAKLITTHFEISLSFEIFPEKLEKIAPTLPEGFVFGELQSKHIPYLFENWKDSFTENISSMEKFLSKFPTSAIFEGDSKTTNPVAFVAFYSYGYVGMLFTHPDYRKRGFAVAVLNNLCNKLKHKKIRFITQVRDDNEVSQKFHRKIGAKLLGKSHWNIYDSKNS